jgi:predicted Zn finger-like uncharacterized protein
MRLVCPNCEAKYEVPEDAIPETGRDVQCANCGHAWYQMRPRAAVAETVAPAPLVAPPVVKAPDPVPPVPAPEPEPDPVAVPEVAATPEPEAPIVEAHPEAVSDPVDAPSEVSVDPEAPADAQSTSEPEPEPTGDRVSEVVAPIAEVTAAEPVNAEVVAGPVPDPAVDPDQEVDLAAVAPAAVTAAPVAYAVDESVLAILREEAEREAHARRSEVAKPLEVQPDLGIDAVAPVTRPVEVLSVDAVAPPVAEDSEDKLAGRKTLLPDVEEINSSLRPTEQVVGDVRDEAAAIAVEGRSSFRSGFLLVLVVAILGAALYISADALSQAVPALAEVLKGYVSMVDSLRLQLDGLMQSATVAINGNGS